MDPNTPNPTQQVQQVPPPPSPPQSGADIPIDIPPPGGSSLKKILIIGGTILGIIAIIVITFMFIVPRLFPSEEQENVELVYWGVWDDEEIFKGIIEEFENKNPHITVKYERQDISNLNDYVPRLQTRISDGQGPDVFRFHNSMVPQLVTGNRAYLLPLPQDVVKSTGIEDEFYPVVQAEMEQGGAYYGIPQYIDTLSLLVNDDIFQDTGYSYPTEWGYFLDLARNLTVVEEDGRTKKIVRPGAALGTYDNVEHAEDIISVLMLQSGLTTENFTDPEQLTTISGVLEYYTCFTKATSRCEPVWSSDMQNSKLAFATGQLPMYFGYSYDLFEILAVNKDLNVKILPVPRLGENNSTVASYWAEGVSSGTKHPEEAYKFIEFLASRENLEKAFANQTRLYGVGGAYPRADMAGMLAENKYLSTVADQAPNAKPFFFYSNTYDGAKNQSLSEAVAEAVNGILADNQGTDSAAETLVTKVADIMGISLTQTEDEE